MNCTSIVSPLNIMINSENYLINDAIVSGRQIRTLANLSPASDYVLILIGDGTARSVGLDEEISLEKTNIQCFVSFRSDRIFSCVINERGFEWGAEEISAVDIRRFGGIPDDHELVLDSKGDRSISDNDVVRLNSKGVERVISRPFQKVCIIVNTREKYIEQRKLSFIELIKLAFPNTVETPDTAYTVSFYKGGGDLPEGTLIEGEKIKLKKGMVFNVSATDKS